MARQDGTIWRFVPAALGLLCAALLTITLVTCSGVADRALSDWAPSNDYGERAFDTYTLVSEDRPDAPVLTVTPPSWVIGVATDGAREENPSQSFRHLTYTFETGNVVFTYATDSVDDFLAWRLNEDTIITSHLFGGRYTNIEVGTPSTATLGGHDVTWGTYSFNDEYGRPNSCFVSACVVADDQVLTVVATESLVEEDAVPFLSEQVLQDIWSGITW
ncbi:MAG: hypothetical protein IKE22_05010 [Atopobiaceae bacterium]|nr:hypothetical protein [Atopobiaceae bacterium]